jgi:hypothetical protein
MTALSYTVWKQVLDIADSQELMLPAGAELLTAREQYDAPCVWFRCDPNAPKTPRTIIMAGTGHQHVPSPEQGRYVGSCSLRGGGLIFHVFERVQ